MKTKYKLYTCSVIFSLLLTGCSGGPESAAEKALVDHRSDKSLHSFQSSKVRWKGKDKSNNDAYVVEVKFKIRESRIMCQMVPLSIQKNGGITFTRYDFEPCNKNDDSQKIINKMSKMLEKRKT